MEEEVITFNQSTTTITTALHYSLKQKGSKEEDRYYSSVFDIFLVMKNNPAYRKATNWARVMWLLIAERNTSIKLQTHSHTYRIVALPATCQRSAVSSTSIPTTQ